MQIMSIIATNKKSCQPSSSVGAAATRSAGESINTDRPQTDSDTDTGVWSHKKRKTLWQEWAVCGALCRIFCLHLWQQQQARRRIPVALTVLQFLLQLIFIAIAVHAASCCNIMVLARYLSKLAAQPNGRQASKQPSSRRVVVVMFVLLLCFLPLFLFLCMFLLLSIYCCCCCLFAFIPLFDNHIPSCRLQSLGIRVCACDATAKNLFHTYSVLLADHWPICGRHGCLLGHAVQCATYINICCCYFQRCLCLHLSNDS